MGGQTTITCAKTGYNANIHFHCKVSISFLSSPLAIFSHVFMVVTLCPVYSRGYNEPGPSFICRSVQLERQKRNEFRNNVNGVCISFCLQPFYGGKKHRITAEVM